MIGTEPNQRLSKVLFKNTEQKEKDDKVVLKQIIRDAAAAAAVHHWTRELQV